jgi:hypothetical protein
MSADTDSLERHLDALFSVVSSTLQTACRGPNLPLQEPYEPALNAESTLSVCYGACANAGQNVALFVSAGALTQMAVLLEDSTYSAYGMAGQEASRTKTLMLVARISALEPAIVPKILEVCTALPSLPLVCHHKPWMVGGCIHIFIAGWDAHVYIEDLPARQQPCKLCSLGCSFRDHSK